MKVGLQCQCCGRAEDTEIDPEADTVDPDFYCSECVKTFTKDPLSKAETVALREPLHIAQIRKILVEKQAAGVMCPVRKKRMMCDMFTATAIIAVWDAIKPETRAKAAKLSLMKLSSVCFKACT